MKFKKLFNSFILIFLSPKLHQPLLTSSFFNHLDCFADIFRSVAHSKITEFRFTNFWQLIDCRKLIFRLSDFWAIIFSQLCHQTCYSLDIIVLTYQKAYHAFPWVLSQTTNTGKFVTYLGKVFCICFLPVFIQINCRYLWIPQIVCQEFFI
jgi:hypothetical protein